MSSPCVKVCSVNNDLCVGCRRSLLEIEKWPTMDAAAKKAWWDTHPVYYAGVGSRDTPKAAMDRIVRFSGFLSQMEYTLSSGAASKGADQAFESAALRKRIFVPERARGAQISFLSLPQDIQDRAMVLAEEHHPAWHRVTEMYSKRLLARNVIQVLGPDLKSPVDFVFFWAPGLVFDEQGRIMDAGGGTGLAVRLAASHGIPRIHVDRPEFNSFYEAIGQQNHPKMHEILEKLKAPAIIAPSNPQRSLDRFRKNA